MSPKLQPIPTDAAPESAKPDPAPSPKTPRSSTAYTPPEGPKATRDYPTLGYE